MTGDSNYQGYNMIGKVVTLVKSWRGSRKLLVVIVAIAIFLDNMLLTCVVPIIPAFLYETHHTEKMIKLNASRLLTTTSTTTNSPEETPILISSLENQLANSNVNNKFNSNTNNVRSNNRKSFKSMDSFHGNAECTCPTNVISSSGTTSSSITSPSSYETTTELMTPEKEAKQLKHKELVEESTEVGVLFASKPVIQAITNPFIGPLTNKIGYSIPMFAGFLIMFLSTLIFAVGKSYPLLLIARSLQGVGSACTSVAGMGMLAERYPDDRERGNAMAIALGGLALGVLIGPPFGGVMYEFVGRASPFLVLSALALLDGVLQLFVLQPAVTPDPQEGASILTLIKDPYILVAAGAITFANVGIGILEPALPLWMMDTMNAPNWEQGAAFLPASISYLIGTNVFGPLGHKMGRWLASMIGIIAIGCALIYIPMATSFEQLILPNGVIGFSIGMVDSSMMPMLGYLVDIRHKSIYGNVYAIGDVAFCVGFIFGPFLSGTMLRLFGFEGLVTITASLCFMFAPFMLLLRKPPAIAENQSLLQDVAVKYVNYTNELTPEEEMAAKKNSSTPLVP
ncbi:synaptic vesicular amine transporter [Tetranychus urticae]|uniref:Major facilitator superfamily (MFS) profile domain-containing protein n=1 Tax=Tetranychus urticae TaxID=32264 RepID=T1K587_TETUR|nr:synaptic vesicular amine transporter [Tetranychus urticae]